MEPKIRPFSPDFSTARAAILTLQDELWQQLESEDWHDEDEFLWFTCRLVSRTLAEDVGKAFERLTELRRGGGHDTSPVFDLPESPAKLRMVPLGLGSRNTPTPRRTPGQDLIRRMEGYLSAGNLVALGFPVAGRDDGDRRRPDPFEPLMLRHCISLCPEDEAESALFQAFGTTLAAARRERRCNRLVYRSAMLEDAVFVWRSMEVHTRIIGSPTEDPIWFVLYEARRLEAAGAVKSAA